jgi:arabinan endo-1,5-alpha-L-arabinosidase
MTDQTPVRRALISVSDKTGIVDFAKRLAAAKVDLISTGGTAKALREAGLAVRDVSDITEFPEMMDGRIKTLHPRVHGGLLALRDDAGHRRSMSDHGIEGIELLVVNLYPFEETVAKGAAIDECIENIDIGGPAMIRAAAKNHPSDAALEDATTPDDDGCSVAVLDNASPPVALELSGNLGTHDPALLEEDGVFYLFQTGPRVPAKTSTDMLRWEAAPSALGSQNPAWVAREVPGATDLWAPDVARFGGLVHLYYSASTFGSNFSCIGHATRASLATGSFQDQGSVICSNHGSNDDWNAIDPKVIIDQEGTPWLFFGSFWSGLQAVKLNQEGTRADDQVHLVASRGGGAIEAPFVIRRCGYYYLFVSFDRCCNGTSSTYNQRVGRSTEVLGPYVDKQGRRLLDGGGSLLVEGNARFRGPGHNAVILTGDRAYNVYHAYDGNMNGAPRLRVSELAFDADGWPVSGGP